MVKTFFEDFFSTKIKRRNVWNQLLTLQLRDYVFLSTILLKDSRMEKPCHQPNWLHGINWFPRAMLQSNVFILVKSSRTGWFSFDVHQGRNFCMNIYFPWFYQKRNRIIFFVKLGLYLLLLIQKIKIIDRGQFRFRHFSQSCLNKWEGNIL